MAGTRIPIAVGAISPRTVRISGSADISPVTRFDAPSISEGRVDPSMPGSCVLTVTISVVIASTMRGKSS